MARVGDLETGKPGELPLPAENVNEGEQEDEDCCVSSELELEEEMRSLICAAKDGGGAASR